jgi:hypothetical protein
LPKPSQEVFDYFFRLQEEVEKEGGMDYRKYAEKLWKNVVAEKVEDKEAFEQFENQIIHGLHKIDMEKIVYPEVIKNIKTLLEKYGDDISMVSLWSKGGVGTGYQISKIHSSNIVGRFHRAIKERFTSDGSFDKEGTEKFLREKTAFMVDIDKEQHLIDYLENLKSKKGQEGKSKVVVIEDNAKTLDSVKQIVADKFDQNIEFVPIWATYSREGQKAKSLAKETNTEKQLDEKREKLNAIDSFDELGDEKKFKQFFQDGHVFVDFDGVIGDNIEMRKKQAEVKLAALVEAVKRTKGVDAKEAINFIENSIPS